MLAAGSTSSSGTGLWRELELEHPPQRAQALGLVVGGLRVLLEGGEALVAHGVLELGDGVGVERVPLAPAPPLIEAARIELRVHEGVGREGALVAHQGLARDHVFADAGYARLRTREVARDELAIEPDRLEDLGAAVAAQRRDAHLGEDLEQPLVRRP